MSPQPLVELEWRAQNQGSLSSEQTQMIFVLFFGIGHKEKCIPTRLAFFRCYSIRTSTRVSNLGSFVSYCDIFHGVQCKRLVYGLAVPSLAQKFEASNRIFNTSSVQKCFGKIPGQCDQEQARARGRRLNHKLKKDKSNPVIKISHSFHRPISQKYSKHCYHVGLNSYLIS